MAYALLEIIYTKLTCMYVQKEVSCVLKKVKSHVQLGYNYSKLQILMYGF